MTDTENNADDQKNNDVSDGNVEQDKSKGLLSSESIDKGKTDVDKNDTSDQEAVTDNERPDYVTEQFWDKDTHSVKTELVFKSYKELRNEFNKISQEKGGKAPESAEDYLKDFTPPLRARPGEGQKEGDELNRYGELDAGDPGFVAISKFAKNGNMEKTNFKEGMQTLMEELHSILPEPFNAEKEKAILGDAAENMIKVNQTWINGLERNGTMNEDETNLLLNFGSTALGVQLCNKLRLNSGEKPIPTNLNNNANTGRKTPDEARAMLEDKRYGQDGPAGEAYRNEVTKVFEETFGTQAA